MILDANALFLPFQFGINIDSELARLLGEHRYVVPSSVVREIERLREAREPLSREAVSLLRHLSPEMVEGTGDADADVISTASEMAGYVLSLDAKVRRAALAAGVPVILMRGRSHLALREPHRRGPRPSSGNDVR